ncbi:MAG TPA: hypothetical protein VN541_14785, partial [Tepidisphaeraceae bacterium]|nr:hypothetical protein [Tepidisphaeraceae bacterium]
MWPMRGPTAKARERLPPIQLLAGSKHAPRHQPFLINSATCRLWHRIPRWTRYTEHLQLGHVPGTEADGIWVATYRLVPAFR